MCGINGFNFRNKELIARMMLVTKHRGPDDKGKFIDDDVSLGHNRLSIIDLSARGHQPMFDRSGRYVIVYNGELYNYQQLRNNLLVKGIKFDSKSDTEVVLKSFIKYGPSCLKKFNGIFSFAIWDKEKKELFLARDHLGVKPLYYYHHNGKFIFSSEIKAILEHNIDKDLDMLSLNMYFRLLYVKGPRTIWKYINKLQPGHYLILKNKKIKIIKYWDINIWSHTLSYYEAKKSIRELTSRAVKRQMMADVPVGLFLSGGLDSTLLLALMVKNYHKKIKTFSVGFADYKDDNRFNQDALFARRTARYFQTDHYEVLINERDVKNNIEKIMWHLDDLVFASSKIASFVLAKLAGREVKVVLSGDGGDELFGGYKRYYFYRLYERWHKMPKILKNNFLLKYGFKLTGKDKIFKRLNMSSFDLFWSFSAHKEEMVAKILSPEINNPNLCRNYFYKQAWGVNNNGDFPNKVMAVELKSWLVDFSHTRSDKMSMAHSLEQRVPLLDIDLVELAMNIPSKYKIDSTKQGKKIFREAFRKEVPQFVLNKEKTGWKLPLSGWLRRGLKDMAYDVISPDYNPQTKNLINFVTARKMLTDHISGQVYALNEIWSLINFQIWYKQFGK